MNTRKLRKAILTLCSALLLVSLSVGITLAYLVDDDAVTNTFTVGKVYIELDETDVDETNTDSIFDGKDENKNHEGRDKANEYHLRPAEEHIKDPIVWVKQGSEKAYLFIKVKNEIGELEQKNNQDKPNIDAQIKANDWIELTVAGLEATEKLYYKVYDKAVTATTEDIDWKFATFNKIYIDDSLNSEDLEAYAEKTETTTDPETGDEIKKTIKKQITVNAYAIQYTAGGAIDHVANTDTATTAWGLLVGQLEAAAQN